MRKNGFFLFLAFMFLFACTFNATAEPLKPLQRLVAPPDGQAYFGFSFRLFDVNDLSYADSRSFDERIQDSIAVELGGKAPTFLTVWAGWQYADQLKSAHPGYPDDLVPFRASADWISNVKRVTGQESLLYLDWTLSGTTADNGGATVKDVASGKLDGYVRDYAAALRSYGGPVLIRLFGGEFNGSWWYGVSPLANHDLSTADFVAAWKRVVDIFRQVGALNVSWAWVPNAYPLVPVPWVDSAIASYYPGDDYVDWAGADLYDGEPDGVRELDAPYAFAAAHHKPFFLAEWGVRHADSHWTPAQQRRFLDDMFDYVESHPDIKAASYFNYCDPGITRDPRKTVTLYDGRVIYQADTNDGDYRLLASGSDFRQAYARRISSPRYISGTISSPVGGPP